MNQNNFDFNFDTQSIDRQTLLDETAKEIEALLGFAGNEESRGEGHRDVDIIREIKFDEADISPPDFIKVTKEDLIAEKIPASRIISLISDDFNFYRLNFNILLNPKSAWGFNKLEMGIRFNEDDASLPRRTKIYEVFPDFKYQTLLQIDQEHLFGWDAKGEVGIKTGSVSFNIGEAGANADAEVKGIASSRLNIRIGPTSKAIKQAQITHTGTKGSWIVWKLQGEDFSKTDRPDFVAYVQVPKKTSILTVSPKLTAYRNFDWLNADIVTQVFPELAKRFRDFLQAGAPLEVTPPSELWNFSTLL